MTASPVEPAVLTLDEAAAYIRVSRNTMRRLRDCRALPVVRLSTRRVGFRRVDLDTYVEEHTDMRTTA